MTVGLGLQRRCTALLALFGLLLQISITAVHHHPDELLRALAGDETAALSTGKAGAPLPTKAPDKSGKDHCLVCLGLQLAGAFLAADRAPLAAPQAVGVAEISAEEELLLSAPPHLLFRTRAPPIA